VNPSGLTWLAADDAPLVDGRAQGVGEALGGTENPKVRAWRVTRSDVPPASGGAGKRPLASLMISRLRQLNPVFAWRRTAKER